MTDRSIAVEDRRRQLVDAAVRVFARKGYHTSRVGDIAEEAGVAHGLLYHYFESKEALLEAVFRDTWSQIVEAIREIEAREEPAGEQLRRVAAEDAAMVGDSLEDDVEGARALGMRAFLVDRENRYPNVEGRLPDLYALPAALGLPRPG